MNIPGHSATAARAGARVPHGAEEAAAARELVRHCLAADAAAVRTFQETFGELIYGYPVRVYRLDEELAGDFYLYAFDGQRLFKRLRSYRGDAPLRAYLLGFVLDSLFLDWQRSRRELETVALDDVPEPVAPPPAGAGDGATALDGLLDGIEPSKAVVMKLLHAEDAEFTARELQYLTRTTGRPLGEVLAGIEALRATVREREADQHELWQELDAVHRWVQLYERRLAAVARALAGEPSAATRQRLADERDELTAKLERRRRQRRSVASRAARHKVTVPYQAIAEFLDTSVGNVGSQITRLRQELQRRRADA